MSDSTKSITSNLALEFALLALLSLFWGASYGFIKLAVETITPVTLVALRVAIAAGSAYWRWVRRSTGRLRLDYAQ